MRQVYKIDSQGLYIEPVLLNEGEVLPPECVEVKPVNGLYKHKWNGKEWVEGLPVEEVEEIKNRPAPLSSKEENEQLKKRVEEAENAILILMDLSL